MLSIEGTDGGSCGGWFVVRCPGTEMLLPIRHAVELFIMYGLFIDNCLGGRLHIAETGGRADAT